MPGLSLDKQILVTPPVSVFGFQRTPPYVRSDLPSLMAPRIAGDNTQATRPGIQMTGFRIIPDAGIMILEPFPLKKDMAVGAFEFPDPAGPSTDWVSALSATLGVALLEQKDASKDHPFDIRSQNEVDANSAFFFAIGRGQALPSATVGPTTYYANLSVGFDTTPSQSVGGATPFALALQDGRPPILQQGIPNPDGSDTWFWGASGQNSVMGTQVTDCSQLFDEQSRTIWGMWLPVPAQNTIIVVLGNGKETLVYRQKNSAPDPSTEGVLRQTAPNLSVIQGKVRFYGKNGTAKFGYFPMAFATQGQLYSEEIDLPFVYGGNGYATIPNADLPTGSGFTGALFPTDFTNRRVKYYIQVTGDGTSSPIIDRISMVIPPTFDYGTTIPGAAIDIGPLCGDISERFWYDQQSGLVRMMVGLKFNNTSGFGTVTTGQHLAAIYSRRLLIDGGGGRMEPYSDWVPTMTGWTGMKWGITKADPRREFDLVLMDNFWPLEVCDAGYLDYGDGWCVLSWLRFLQNMQGRLDDFIGDEMKTCAFGPNPAGCTHFKLPSGVGGTPKMGVDPTQKFLAAMVEVLQMVHGIMWCDPSGVSHVMPYAWLPLMANKGTFRYTGSGDPANPAMLGQMWHEQRITVDTSDRRTGVAFFGRDPALNCVQGTFLNAEDIAPGWVERMHGFRQPYVKVDSRFVDPDFTARFAEAAFERITVPTVLHQHGACFLPGLFPLDQFTVEANSVDITGTATFVTEEIRSQWSARHAGLFGSTIAGRWTANVF